MVIRGLLAVLLAVMIVPSCGTRQPRGLPPASGAQEKGVALLGQGRPLEARELFRRSLVTGDEPFLAHVGMARADIALGRWSAFEVEMRAALATCPATPEAWDLAGRTLLEAAKRRGGAARQQNAAMAAHVFTRARARAPELPGLTYHVGLTQYLAGRVRESVTFFELAHREDPDSPEVWEALAMAYRSLGARERLTSLLEPLEREARLPPTLVPHLEWARETGGEERPESRPVPPDR